MARQSLFQRLDTFGYYLLPRPHRDSPGYSGLIVVLRLNPEVHQPKSIQLRLHEWDGKSTTMSLHANTNQSISHAVCPGRVVIRSREEREVTFYTFGGQLDSEEMSGETVYSLRSTAPVLELSLERESPADLLADETEALYARAEAKLQLSSKELLHRLVTAGPESVYTAVLQSLSPDNSDPAVSYQHHADFHAMIQNERKWLEETKRWPLFPQEIEILLENTGKLLKQM